MSPSDRSSTAEPTVEVQEQAALLQTFLTTVHHFFGNVAHLFAGITDPRHPELITYPLAALLFAGLLLFVCRLGGAPPSSAMR